MDTSIKRVEIVPASYDPKKFELLITHGDGSQMYFSRGFATKKEAEAVKRRLMPKGGK